MTVSTRAERFRQLLRFAEENHLRTRDESRGMCLHTTRLLAERARDLGLADEVRLVRWRVTADPEFREHWALTGDGASALDMAAAQVDGDPTPLRAIASYPDNYVAMRIYPLDPVLTCLAPACAEEGGRYSRMQILRLHRHLWRIDGDAAVRSLSLPGMLAATGRLVEAAFVLAAGHVLERAIQRLSRTLRKLG